MVDFLFVIIELFRYLLRLRRYKRKSVKVGVFRKGEWVTLSASFRRKGASSTNHFWCQKTTVTVLSSIVSKYPQCIIWFCHKARVWQTDGQNYDSQDRASIAALRSKNDRAARWDFFRKNYGKKLGSMAGLLLRRVGYVQADPSQIIRVSINGLAAEKSI